MRRTSYRPDLAFIHDAGFGDFAAGAARELLQRLRRLRQQEGLVIDLGCGSGILAAEVTRRGCRVLGYDLSEAMVALSQQRAPEAEFHRASYLDAPLPPCIAVTAIGEVFNYRFDRRSSLPRLGALFQRVHAALQPGGLFLFDAATPGRVPGGAARVWREGEGWTCVVSTQEDAAARTLTRRITTFRKVGELYQRDAETHRLRLYDPQELVALLREAGFRVRRVRSYGKVQFPPGYVAFAARKA